jgi:hypothetical protein
MVKNGLADDGICLDEICSKMPIMSSMLVLQMVLKFDCELNIHIGVA